MVSVNRSLPLSMTRGQPPLVELLVASFPAHCRVSISHAGRCGWCISRARESLLDQLFLSEPRRWHRHIMEKSRMLDDSWRPFIGEDLTSIVYLRHVVRSYMHRGQESKTSIYRIFGRPRDHDSQSMYTINFMTSMCSYYYKIANTSTITNFRCRVMLLRIL